MYLKFYILLLIQKIKFFILMFYTKSNRFISKINKTNHIKYDNQQQNVYEFSKIGFNVPLYFFDDFMTNEITEDFLNKMKEKMGNMTFIGTGKNKGIICHYAKKSINLYITNISDMFQNKKQWKYLEAIIESHNDKKVTYKKKYIASTFLFKYRKQYFNYNISINSHKQARTS